MNLNRPYLFLDIDDVMVTSKQYFFSKVNPLYDGMPFDFKCVNVLNKIIEEVNPIIIISSDWKLHYNLQQLNRIFAENKINSLVTDVTPDLWGHPYVSLSQLEECRAEEILKYQIEHANVIDKWVAVDDLNLRSWIPDNFVYCTKSTEGLKQTNVKEKILNIIK